MSIIILNRHDSDDDDHDNDDSDGDSDDDSDDADDSEILMAINRAKENMRATVHSEMANLLFRHP